MPMRLTDLPNDILESLATEVLRNKVHFVRAEIQYNSLIIGAWPERLRRRRVVVYF